MTPQGKASDRARDGPGRGNLLYFWLALAADPPPAISQLPYSFLLLHLGTVMRTGC